MKQRGLRGLKRGIAFMLSVCLLAGGTPLGVTAFADTITYDELNRITSIEYDNGSKIEYTYDANGNITEIIKDIKEVAAPGKPSDSGTDTPGGGSDKPGDGNTTGGGQNPGQTDPGQTPGQNTPVQTKVGVKFNSKNLRYKITQDGTVKAVSVIGEKTKKKTTSIPDTVTYQGVKYKVTEIGANAYKNQKKLTKVTIGKNVCKIGSKCFYGCKKLKNVTVKSKVLKSVGKKAFSGTHAKLVVKVPKSKLKTYKKLLKNKGMKKSAKVKK